MSPTPSCSGSTAASEDRDGESRWSATGAEPPLQGLQRRLGKVRSRHQDARFGDIGPRHPRGVVPGPGDCARVRNGATFRSPGRVVPVKAGRPRACTQGLSRRRPGPASARPAPAHRVTHRPRRRHNTEALSGSCPHRGTRPRRPGLAPIDVTRATFLRSSTTGSPAAR